MRQKYNAVNSYKKNLKRSEKRKMIQIDKKLYHLKKLIKIYKKLKEKRGLELKSKPLLLLFVNVVHRTCNWCYCIILFFSNPYNIIIHPLLDNIINVICCYNTDRL